MASSASKRISAHFIFFPVVAGVSKKFVCPKPRLSLRLRFGPHGGLPLAAHGPRPRKRERSTSQHLDFATKPRETC